MKKRTDENDRKRICFLPVVILLYVFFLMLSLNTVFGAGSQVVRIGYYERSGFQEGMSDEERKSGYAYEYLQKISDYTGWQYEYVYGDLAELKSKFEQDEIDILAGISEKDEMPANAEFAEKPFGSESCYIYKKLGDSSIKIGYASGLIGKKVGVIRNSKEKKHLDTYMEKTGLFYDLTEYNSLAGMQNGLEQGEIDAFAAEDMEVCGIEDVVPCILIGNDDYYVCVSAKKRTILRELNDADSRLREDEPYYLEKLFSRYYQGALTNNVQSEEETAWLLVHDELKIGYVENNLPFCGTDEDGNVTGLLSDIIEAMKEEEGLSELKIEAVPFATEKSACKALADKEISAVFPAFTDAWTANRSGTRVSTNVADAAMDVIFAGQYSEKVFDTLAVSKSQTVQEEYVQKYYPDSRILYVDSMDDCIRAVKEGKASATLMNRYHTTEYLMQTVNRELHSAGVSDACEHGFAVRSADTELLALLNRSIRMIGSERLSSWVNKYSYEQREYSVEEFIATHLVGTMLAVVIFVGMLLLLFLLYVHNSKKSKCQMQRAQDQINKAKEELEVALQRAESASEAKSKFLFNMSHDIRTPMNAIMGYTELLEKSAGNPDRKQAYLQNIRKSGSYLLDLINEVLEMARIESGEISLDENPGNLQEMYDTLEAMFREECRKNRQKLTFDIRLTHPFVYYDEVKVKEIFLNILSNAVKYTEENDTVTVQAEELSSAGEYITVKTVITDTGIGISKEFLPRIFDSFSREKTVTENKIVGSGLGMGIVKKYVDLMKGETTVASELGKGTTVSVTLKLKKAQMKECLPVPEEKPEEDGKGMKILLAEDNELNREIAEELLKGVGFHVESVEDGVECVTAMKHASKDQYDLILMDIQMPRMNGFEAAKMIRQLSEPEKAGIKIIALTANVFDTDRKNAEEAGMDGFVGKPMEIPKLMQEIQRIFQKK